MVEVLSIPVWVFCISYRGLRWVRAFDLPCTFFWATTLEMWGVSLGSNRLVLSLELSGSC